LSNGTAQTQKRDQKPPRKEVGRKIEPFSIVIMVCTLCHTWARGKPPCEARIKICASTFETCRSSDLSNYMIFYIIIGHMGNKIQILLDIDDFFSILFKKTLFCCVQGCMIVELQGCIIVALQGCVIVKLQGCVNVVL
jgi:hypothetical protein